MQDPYYWWVAGALWGAMLDYYHYTKDPTYNDIVIQALLHPTNLGQNLDYMPKEHELEEGNDDLFFWGSAVISAAERNFPQPNSTLPSWLDLGANVFNELVSRWNTSHCGGGLLWQIYPSNPNGMNYKNSVSNGGFFQLSARMARATGNNTYLDWANKIWDWSNKVNFIDQKNYHVYDGADSRDDCGKTNYHSFTYTSGIYLYGAAILADHTGKDEWKQAARNLLNGTNWFFSPFSNTTNVMYEAACETVMTCNADMSTFKGYLSRFMWQTVQLLPDLRDDVEKVLNPSALAAARGCSGGKSGRECSMRWWEPGYDGNPGLGQQMCALETIQGLLSHEAEPPLKGDQIKVVRDTDWSNQGNSSTESVPSPTESATPKATESDDAASNFPVSLGWMSLTAGTAMLVLGLA